MSDIEERVTRSTSREVRSQGSSSSSSSSAASISTPVIVSTPTIRPAYSAWTSEEELEAYIVSRINESTSARSNASQMIGQMINLDYGLFISPEEWVNTNGMPLQDYMIKLLAIQDSLMEAAKQQLLSLDNIHLSSKSGKQFEFAIDSFVLVRYHKSAPPTRLHTI